MNGNSAGPAFKEVILQHLLMPDDDIRTTRELYLHEGPGQAWDLDGYFNLFYIEKHRKYTAIEELCLHLTLRGFACAVLMQDRQEIRREAVDAGGVTELRLVFPYGEETDADTGMKTGSVAAAGPGGVGGRPAVFWLRLIPDPAVPETERMVRGYYAGVIAPDAVRDVQIAVAICTYRRESYVLRNLTRMLALFDQDPALAAHYHVFVVDNGKTLVGMEGMRALLARSGGRIRLISNRNTGGTGGFTRGMEEAIARRDELHLTHLMLLDDDAVFDRDLFVRVYGFVSILKDACRDMTVGGSMWLEDMPYMQHAAGEWFKRFAVSNPHPSLDLRQFDSLVCPSMTVADEKSGLYSGWWCCTYSMAVIRRENLLPPLFVHGDDIQFGLAHADQGIVFLNGIGVWHTSFELSFPGVKEYYNTRNFLMTSALFDPGLSCRHVIRWMIKQVSGPLLSFRYGELHLAYRGITDYLRGPDWLYAQDVEKLHQSLTEAYKKEASLQPLRELLGPERYVLFAAKYMNDEAKKRAIVAFHQRGKIKGRWWQYLTLNGWILPARRKTGLFTIANTPWELYRAGRALLYEPDTGRGCYARRDGREMLRACFMVAKLSVLILLKFPRVSRKWRQMRGIE